MTVPLSKYIIIFLLGRQYQSTVSQQTTYVHLRSFKSRCQYYIKQTRELGAERDASERLRGGNIYRKGHPSDCNAGLIPMTGEGKEAGLCRKRLWVQCSHEKAWLCQSWIPEPRWPVGAILHTAGPDLCLVTRSTTQVTWHPWWWS